MDSDAARLLDAAEFAAQKHREQRRKDPEGTPFINHPIEDTDTTFAELEARFGGAVTGLVREVTDDKELPRAERKRLQVERAPSRSPRAKLLQLADKLHNLRDIARCPPAGWSPERVQEYFQWAAQVVSGLRGTSPALEAALERLWAERATGSGP
ncbi:MESH1 pyrophosphohydrolase, partial [Probosciger aterrimus]|nr:MESH1 pyrophosphohydrolase [Probosciger aterrimus]